MDGKQRLGLEADDSSSTNVVIKNMWRFPLHHLPPNINVYNLPHYQVFCYVFMLRSIIFQ